MFRYNAGFQKFFFLFKIKTIYFLDIIGRIVPKARSRLFEMLRKGFRVHRIESECDLLFGNGERFNVIFQFCTWNILK